MKNLLLKTAILFIPVAEIIQYWGVSSESFYESDFKNWLVVYQVHDVFMYLITLIPWAFIFKNSTGHIRGFSFVMMAIIFLVIIWNYFQLHTDARYWVFYPVMVIAVIIGISLSRN